MEPTRRRNLLKASLGGAAMSAAGLGPLLFSREARAQIGSTLTIAYNTQPPSWDPNAGLTAVVPGAQSIARSIFDPFFVQREDLSLAPGACDQFAWNADRSAITLRVRPGMTWHDGKPVTPDDVAWNLNRLTDPGLGSPLQVFFASMKNIRVKGDEVSFDVQPYRANMLERLTFLGCYLLPPHYYKDVGREGFEKQPMGSGPYMFEKFERGSFLRLKANPRYWGGAPAFETVIFKFATDSATRIAEVERGSADITLDIPWEEFDRLKHKPALVGVARPMTDIALMFFNNVGPMADPNVRRAAVHAIDKKLIVERIQRGHATPVDTLLAPQYKAYDAAIQTPYDPALAAKLLAQSGWSRDKPVEFTVQTTKGYKPKDYETVQAIVEMWRRVGIKANLEVYEIAKHSELRTQHKLAPAAFYSWSNSTADPESAALAALLSKSPSSSWKGGELDALLMKLVSEKNEAARMEGYKELNREVAKNAFILPLFQVHQSIVHRKGLQFEPHLAGWLLPYRMRPAPRS
jgi:peptide/nickel transport system substrate-binding protein